MQSIGQAIYKIKSRLIQATDEPVSESVISEDFLTDSSSQSSISLAILSYLTQSWQRLSYFNIFVFMNRDCSSVYVGFGDLHDFDEPVQSSMPVFIAAEFSKTGKRQKLVPRVLLSTSESVWPEMTVSCSIFSGLAATLSILESVGDSFRPVPVALPFCESFEDTGMSKDEYLDRVKTDLAEMVSTPLEKIVYARRVTFNMSGSINPAALLYRVVEETESKDYGKRFVILFHQPGSTFVSVSPELLCRLKDGSLSTEALAGTCPSTNPGDLISGDPKLVEEHGAVGRYIETLLKSLGGPIESSLRQLVQLRDVTHYRQQYTVSTQKLISELLEWSLNHLHPTPAVCGFPSNLAMSKIIENEKFHRFFFSGPLGLVSQFSAELCVGLRAAHIDGNNVNVFAGAGIVAGSDPALEWEEMELKMAQFTQVLAHGDGGQFLNQTAQLAAAVVNELLRSGVEIFVVCPGSRSSPLTLAVHRRGAPFIVIPDERAAGFYAVGAARGGAKCAVIVTSGTAVANLVPSVCEAAEAGLSLIILTADRPSESHGIGEYQTINGQSRIFAPFTRYSKSFVSTDMIIPILADVAYAVSLGGVTHLNFEIRKCELSNSDDLEKYSPYTCDHIHPRQKDSPFRVLPARTLFICGELLCRNEQIGLASFCEKNEILCFADVLSGLNPSKYIVMGLDQLMGSLEFVAWLERQNFALILRVGGPLISSRLQAWTPRGAHVVRIRPHRGISRHDPQWAAHEYIQADLGSVISNWSVSKIEGKNKLSGDLIKEIYSEYLRESFFCEPLIAKIVGEEADAVFLSSSMPCRDFDLIGRTKGPVGCNRGVNGIDGVIASALGFAHAHKRETTLLIGDVATLHDLGSIPLVLNIHPGHQETKRSGLKVVCLNNEGGAIFSFLPVRTNPGFSPFFDTPHMLNFANIVNGMHPGCACRVSNACELRTALRNAEIRFIECVGLPNHDDNVKMHKEMGTHVAKIVLSEIE